MGRYVEIWGAGAHLDAGDDIMALKALGEGVGRLLDHPCLAGARARAHEHRLGNVDAAGSEIGRLEEELGELLDVVDRVPCRVDPIRELLSLIL